MKGDPKVIEILNEVLTAELTAINQYFVHAEMCENWGYERLLKIIRKESIDEMKHAEKLIERILFLEGIPNVQRLWKINIGESVPEIFKADYLAFEILVEWSRATRHVRSFRRKIALSRYSFARAPSFLSLIADFRKYTAYATSP